MLAEVADPDADDDEDRRGAGAARGRRSTRPTAWRPRPHDRDRDGRAAPAARRRRRHDAVRRRAAARRAVPAAAVDSPTCCCSTSRPTTSTPSRVAWLERHLPDYPGTVVAVTHDRYFLDNVAGWILELDRGRGIPFEGNYSSLAGAEAGAPRPARRRQDERAPAHARARAGVGAHVAQGPPGQGQGPARAPTRSCWPSAGERAAATTARDPHPAGPAPRRRGRSRPSGLRKGYGDRLLIEDLSFTLPPGGIVGVIGPNGAGKTTLFRMITGAGEARRRRAHASATTVRARLRRPDPRQPRPRQDRLRGDHRRPRPCSMVGNREIHSRAYVAAFNFKGPDQQKKVGALSGGERNRVHLAKLLKRGGNVLLLDEPTNDLDVDTLRALEEALLELRRLRGRHQPRPLVPRPHRHPHPRLRGRQPGRAGSRATSRTTRRRRKERLGADADQPAPDQVQAAHASLTASWSVLVRSR